MPPKGPSKRSRSSAKKAKGPVCQVTGQEGPCSCCGPNSKQKLRNAAKSRRDQESEEFARMASLLPFPTDAISRMDRSAVLRLTIAYLQARHLAITPHMPAPADMAADVKEGELLLETMEGFLLVVTRQGRIIYVSEQVTNCLGFQAYEMAGADLFEFVPEVDYQIFLDQFRKKRTTPSTGKCSPCSLSDCEDNCLVSPLETSEKKPEVDETWLEPGMDMKREFAIRMRYKIVNDSNKTKQTGYITLQWMGKLRMMDVGGRKKMPVTTLGMVAVCRPTISITLQELPLYERTFIIKYGPGNKCTYCDDRITGLMGYDPTEFVGSTLLEYFHPDDFELKLNCFKNMWVRGYEKTCLFRLINKMGRWVWIRSRCLVVYGPKKEPIFIVGMHYVLSEKEGKELIAQRRQGSILLSERPSAQEPFTTGNWETILQQKTMQLFPPNIQNIISFSNIAERRKALMLEVCGSPDPPISEEGAAILPESTAVMSQASGGLSDEVPVDGATVALPNSGQVMAVQSMSAEVCSPELDTEQQGHPELRSISDDLLGLPEDLTSISLDTRFLSPNEDVDMVDIFDELLAKETTYGNFENDETHTIEDRSIHNVDVSDYIGHNVSQSETLLYDLDVDSGLNMGSFPVTHFMLGEQQILDPDGHVGDTRPNHVNSVSSDDGYCGSVCSRSSSSHEGEGTNSGSMAHTHGELGSISLDEQHTSILQGCIDDVMPSLTGSIPFEFDINMVDSNPPSNSSSSSIHELTTSPVAEHLENNSENDLALLHLMSTTFDMGDFGGPF